MTSLYERLLEICKDQGVENPRPKDISRVCKLSSGRPKQIKDAREFAKLSGDTLQVLSSIGYSILWVQEGKGPKFQNDPPGPLVKQDHVPYATADETGITQDEWLLIDWYRAKTEEERKSFFSFVGIKKQIDFAESA